MLPTDLPANPNPGFASWPASPPPPPQIPLQSPPSPSFFAKNKKPLILAGILLIIFTVGGFAGMKFLIKKPSAPEVAQKPQVPQIFVAEQVTQAERKDLDIFAQCWQEALAQKGSFADYKKLTLGECGRFKNVPILKIGEETLYGNDLNYLFLFYHFQDYTSASKIPQEALNKVVDEATSDSVILQEAIKENLLTSSVEFFNSSDKDYTTRNEKINFAKQSLSDKFVQKISGETISIWFNNDVSPLGVEQGKKLALAKMQDLQQKIKSGQLTFAQAGEAIKNDAEIGQKIDPAYKNNAHFIFSDIEKGKGPFTMENLNQEAWSLGEGQESDIVIGKAATANGQQSEQLYMIIKINKRTGEAKAANTDELINNYIKQTQKENLNL